jgi:hypothetical protein
MKISWPKVNGERVDSTPVAQPTLAPDSPITEKYAKINSISRLPGEFV